MRHLTIKALLYSLENQLQDFICRGVKSRISTQIFLVTFRQCNALMNKHASNANGGNKNPWSIPKP